MAKTTQTQSQSLSIVRLLILLAIPLAWGALSHFGLLQFLENHLLDLRFRVRGEIAAPAVKLIYVDVDTDALEVMGERPWSRAIYADIAEALIVEGGAKAIGFDFVMSKSAQSALIDQAKAKQGNNEFAKLIGEHPRKIVLAVNYTPGSAEMQEDDYALRRFPFIRKGFVDPSTNDGPEKPEPPLDHPSVRARFGLIDVDVEYSGDEVPRWVPLFAHTEAAMLLHMSLQLLLQLHGLNEDAVRIEADRLEVVRPDGTRVVEVPLHEGQLLEVNWFSPWISRKCNPRHSVMDVLSVMAALDPDNPEMTEAHRKKGKAFFEEFKDAIVLIGPVDPNLQDLAPTPFDSSPVAKVGVHGNLLKTIITGKFLTRLPPWVNHAITFSLAVLIGILVFSGGEREMRGKIFKVLAVVVVGLYVAAAFWGFSHSHLILPMVAPLGAAVTTAVGGLYFHWRDEQERRREAQEREREARERANRIKGMFGTYISRALVDEMVESGVDPELGGEEKEITAYFSDIQGFSQFSELFRDEPKKLVELMNEYLTACTNIVQEQGGTLDKYIGDAVVAMYGAPIPLPDHAFRACVATQLVHQRLNELRKKWKGEGDKWSEKVWNMQSRIGLNSGKAIIGNMGSESRFNYTMMGDNVNLAARMESGAKRWGVYTMIADDTRVACEKHADAGRVILRPLRTITVMGRQTPVPIYEIVGLRETVTPTTLECLGLFAQGRARLLDRDWDGAIALFNQSKELEPNQPGKMPGVKSNPSLVFIEDVEKYKLNDPGPGWDGVFEMTEK